MKPKRCEFATSQPYAEAGPRSSSVPRRWRLLPGGATHFGSGWPAPQLSERVAVVAERSYAQPCAKQASVDRPGDRRGDPGVGSADGASADGERVARAGAEVSSHHATGRPG